MKNNKLNYFIIFSDIAMRDKTLIHCGTVLLPLGANITPFRWLREPNSTPGDEIPRGNALIATANP